MTKDELAKVLEDHIKWLRSEEGGNRANLRDANLGDANLSGANLRDANLNCANLRDANLSHANLSGADLSGANLIGASLRGANLRGATLYDANLFRATLYDANLHGADLRGSNLRGADLSSADLDKRYIIISCIGSRKRSTTYCFDDDQIWCGCFMGTLDEFEAACLETHAEHPQYLKEYLGAIGYIRSLAASNSNTRGEL